MKWRFIANFALLLLILIPTVHATSLNQPIKSPIQFESTRVYLNGDQREGFLTVRNNSDVPYYLVAKILDVSTKSRSKDFLVSPPSVMLSAKDQLTLRIVRVSDSLSKEIESASFLQLRLLPGEREQTDNRIKAIYNFFVKVFYRSKGLQKTDAIEDAVKKMGLACQNREVSLKNNSPYWLTIVHRADNKQNSKTWFVPPWGLKKQPFDVCPDSLNLQFINESGVASKSSNFKVGT